MNLIVDEKLAANDKEQNQTGKDVAEGTVQTKLRDDLAGSAAEKDQQEAGQNHPDGIELGQPGDHNGCESAPVHDRGSQRVIGTTDQQKPGETTHRTG